MSIEKEHQDVLQNIEFSIVSMYREFPDLIKDSNVLSMIDALIDYYVASKIGRSPRNFNLSPMEQKMLEKTREICDWRLGKIKAIKGIKLEGEQISLDVLLECIKRIQKSIKTWNKDNGIKGYLDFVAKYIK